MRTAVACFVLAAAIATPGIVLAATTSGGHGVVLVPDVVTGSTAAGQFHPTGPKPVDSRLRPAVDAVRRALERRGSEPVHVFPALPGMAQLVQLPTSVHQCATTVTFQFSKPQRNGIVMQDVGNGPHCGSGSTDYRGVHVTYSPKSLGFVIREALATLPS